MKTSGENGPLAGSIIVAVIIVIGAVYVFTHRPIQNSPLPEEITEAPDPVLEATLVPQSTSTNTWDFRDDYSRIPKDKLDADFEDLDQDLR